MNPAHLRIGSQKENAADRKLSGTQPMGTHHYASKLTPTKVRNIRKLYNKGWLLEALAKRYDVAVGSINDVINGKTWKHVDDGVPLKKHDGRRKLTPDDTTEVIRLYLSKELSAVEIAKRFHLDDTYVRALGRKALKQ